MQSNARAVRRFPDFRKSGADGRTRTDTTEGLGILSAVRLPFRHIRDGRAYAAMKPIRQPNEGYLIELIGFRQ